MRDFFTILDFDLNVQYYQRQPASVTYTDPSGAQSAFTPEFLITYRRDIEPARRMRPLLCDVMTRQDVFENWATLAPAAGGAALRPRAEVAVPPAHRARDQDALP
jgi:hypothetical protein